MIFAFEIVQSTNHIETNHKRTLSDLQRMRVRGVNYRVKINTGTSSYARYSDNGKVAPDNMKSQ